MTTEIEAALRSELRTQWVPVDPDLVQHMIDRATSVPLLGERSWAAPLGAAAAVVVMAGGAAAIATTSGTHHGPAGGDHLPPAKTAPAPVPTVRPTPTRTEPTRSIEHSIRPTRTTQPYTPRSTPPPPAPRTSAPPLPGTVSPTPSRRPPFTPPPPEPSPMRTTPVS